MQRRQPEEVGDHRANEPDDRVEVAVGGRLEHAEEVLALGLGCREAEREQRRDVVTGERVLVRQVLVVDDLEVQPALVDGELDVVVAVAHRH